MKKKIFIITFFIIAIASALTLSFNTEAIAKGADTVYLNITVENMDGSTQSGVSVRLKLPNGNYHSDGVKTSDIYGNVGFPMTDLSAGTYRIEADYPPGHRSGAKNYYYTTGTENTNVVLNIFY